MNVDGGGDRGSGPQPNAVPETLKAPGSGRQPLLNGGGDPAPPATSIQPKVSGGLSTALESASIIDEHRALMGAMIEKVQSAKSGLTEACTSLLTGFEVRIFKICRVVLHRQ